MNVRFEVKAEGLKELEKWAKRLAKNQIPYVTAKTLTDLAGEVNRAATQNLRRHFTLRNQYVARSFRKTMADKRQWPYCYSRAGSVAPFLKEQVLGGTKTGKNAAWMGVPLARGERLGGRPTINDVIGRPLWVTNLLKRTGYLMVPGKVSKAPLLLKQTRTGKRRNHKHPGAVRLKRTHHTGKRGWKRETIYVMKKDVKIPARFPFYDIAKRTIKQRYEDIFKRNLERALR